VDDVFDVFDCIVSLSLSLSLSLSISLSLFLSLSLSLSLSISLSLSFSLSLYLSLFLSLSIALSLSLYDVMFAWSVGCAEQAVHACATCKVCLLYTHYLPATKAVQYLIFDIVK
jgi:hypothetical protein